MAKGDARKKSETTHFGLRMREAERARIEESAADNGRSMNSEIIHRLEDYERLSRAYELYSQFPEARKACQIIAALADHIVENENAPHALELANRNRPDLFHRAISMYFSRPSDPIEIVEARKHVDAVRDFFDPPHYRADHHLVQADDLWRKIEPEMGKDVLDDPLMFDLNVEMMADHVAAAAAALDQARNAAKLHKDAVTDFEEKMNNLPPRLKEDVAHDLYMRNLQKKRLMNAAYPEPPDEKMSTEKPPKAAAKKPTPKK